MAEKMIYYPYSQYLKKIYGEKVYKLPVNLPVTCPNRMGGQPGCAFCAEVGTGFESQSPKMGVKEQLLRARSLIEKKYHAHKFIAYFQNYTNTFLRLPSFQAYVREASQVPDVVEIAVSTRPDCVRREYLDVLGETALPAGQRVTVELGLQTANYHTLQDIHRGHSLAEFIDAVLAIKTCGFDVCVHVILNLPGDTAEDAKETAKILSALGINIVKIHSLYIAKNTLLCEAYENGTMTICSKEEYLSRLQIFLEFLDPGIAVERLFSRIPKDESVFCNWGTSWWKLRDEFEDKMQADGSFQGKRFHYLNGAALEKLEAVY